MDTKQENKKLQLENKKLKLKIKKLQEELNYAEEELNYAEGKLNDIDFLMDHTQCKSCDHWYKYENSDSAEYCCDCYGN